MPDAPTGAQFEEQLRNANEELYKHSHDLAIRNKTLSLLRQLYQISILSLHTKELADKIVNAVCAALDMQFVVIMTYDRGIDALVPLAAATPDGEAAKNVELADARIEHVSQVSGLAPVLRNEEMHTAQCGDIWGGACDVVLKALGADEHLRSLSAHPLMIDGALTGVIIFGINRAFDDLTQFERESIGSLVDVTAVALDRARIYEALQEANDRQVTLIHFITHQIKGYVTKSRNLFSMLLEGDYGQVPDTMKPLLQQGLESDTHGVNTIQEILNAANIKSGKVTYTKTSVDLKALTEQIVAELKPNADAKSLALSVSAEDGAYTITADLMQLTNAIKNLVDNSIKYTPSGSVAVALAHDAGEVKLIITDTGVGITPEDMKMLFTEGGHGKESQKVNVESTGFGLYIVKNIVEAHGGKVWAESEGAGKGSRFIMELPMGA